MKYTVTISEAELDVVRLALGRMLEAKPIVERKPRNLGVFDPDTGDGALDTFMRASRLKNGPPKPERAKPTPKFPYGLSKSRDPQARRNWADAVNDPARWRFTLLERAARAIGRTAIQVLADNGIDR
jgi:hypothetical protein